MSRDVPTHYPISRVSHYSTTRGITSPSRGDTMTELEEDEEEEEEVKAKVEPHPSHKKQGNKEKKKQKSPSLPPKYANHSLDLSKLPVGIHPTSTTKLPIGMNSPGKGKYNSLDHGVVVTGIQSGTTHIDPEHDDDDDDDDQEDQDQDQDQDQVRDDDDDIIVRHEPAVIRPTSGSEQDDNDPENG